jgi:hypothetical protein
MMLASEKYRRRQDYAKPSNKMMQHKTSALKLGQAFKEIMM